ncbi:5-oxoprolinase subunit PxpB [Clostridium botulinum]|uniref:5-oxoprolinase subunit PxpB n=1 Tax=Clostridium botulinum TaxID=1491 RepID=UPI00052DC96E|nr:5-oxoprolinase subunit PxpB [Clostridium botulinum]KGM95798.1 kinase inhibitor [Clostridium botulinum D str. CCUG 7971]KOC47152.1 kinase inhibitor [Clostridium botulinum]NFO98320.1 5-oxoprolinase subunit PxpB [Clostridium botulinum]OOV51895.1 kinase inhibitor [Clostridium botulinum D/C]OOV53615.1 kinase inhibitor [Clostridium botulinum D/C]
MGYNKLMTIKPMGDCAITLKFSEDINIDTHLKIKSLSEYLDKNPFEWMVEYVPSFVSLTIFYNPLEVIKEFSEKSDIPFNIVKSQIEKVLSKLEEKVIDNPKIVEIPVCYGGEFGPDLSFVAEHNNLTIEEVIDIHSSFENRVYMIGFAPGFPYLAGMSNRISTPRRITPRLSIPAGSVGIAGNQTGVYPISTPGGWQLIGRTPVDLFNPQSESPSILKVGDIVKFKEILRKEYYEIKYSKEEKILKWA